MKKVLVTLFLGLVFCNTAFTESYYFKECYISEEYYGNYLINIDKNIIEVSFVGKDGLIQELTDKIELIEEDQIVSEKIQSGKVKDHYFIYYLDVNSKSIMKQIYKKDVNNIFWPEGPKKQSFCASVKADWAGSKEKAEKKQADLKAEEERKRIEDKKKQLELTRKEEEKRKKEKKKNNHNISIEGEYFDVTDTEKQLESEKKLKKDFNKRAFKICSLTGNFDLLEQNVKVVDVGRISCWPKVCHGMKLGIEGVVECK